MIPQILVMELEVLAYIPMGSFHFIPRPHNYGRFGRVRTFRRRMRG
jgi:hypothetical protein